MAAIDDTLALMQELGPAAEDIAAVLQTADAEWAVAYDPQTAVAIDVDDAGVLGLSIELGHPAAERQSEVYGALLAYNTLQRETGGVTMALALWNGLVKQYFPNKDHQTLVNHVRNDVNNRGEKLEEQVAPFRITNKIDTWSMGASVYQAFTGQYGPFEGDFVFEIENKIKEFGNDKTRRIIEPKDRPNGLTDVDRLINDMMHPDPNQRPTISQALKSPVFSDLRLGTDDVRNLIKKLCDKNATPEELRELSNRIV